MPNGKGERGKITQESRDRHQRAADWAHGEWQRSSEKYHEMVEQGATDHELRAIEEHLHSLQEFREMNQEFVKQFNFDEMEGKNDLLIVVENEIDDREIEMTTTLSTSMGVDHGKIPDEIKLANADNLDTSRKTDEIIKTFWETYQKDSETNLRIAIAGLATGLVVALAGLAVASAGLYYGVNPKQPPSPAPPAPTPGPLNANLAAANARIGDEKKMTEAEIEEMMQRLVASKGAIASGKVPQEMLWHNLADKANKTSIDDQSLTLIFVQQASVRLEGTREFLWLDPRDAKERYDALREAHKRSGKFADVYLEAAKIKYDDKPVPMFHVASLIQYALPLIRLDLGKAA
jgi:hypothetical protein